MKHTKEEIINALKVIKDECNQTSECDDCPFADKNNNCAFSTEVPPDWEIAELPPPEKWRALK